jgi:uncharacterized coiled-coil protein SlyX
MTEPTENLVPLLRKMRVETLNEDERTQALLTVLVGRFSSVESAEKSFRQILAADRLIAKLVDRDFEARIETLEQKIRDLETIK